MRCAKSCGTLPAAVALRSDHFNGDQSQQTQKTVLDELCANDDSAKIEGLRAQPQCFAKRLTLPEKGKAPIPFGDRLSVPFAKKTSLQLVTPTVEGLIDKILSLEGLT